MAPKNSRLEELLEGNLRRRRVIVSPEGVPLDIQVAGLGERLAALCIDLAFMYGTVILLYLLLLVVFLSRFKLGVGTTVILFTAFVVRNLYFLHFELAWQGRTPGKRICGLRVINRKGGELAPSAVIARNLTREVELFLPLYLFFSLGVSENLWQFFCLGGWILLMIGMPLCNRDRLRAGDLIGGTQVIAMPRRVLLDDLSAAPQTPAGTQAQAPAGPQAQAPAGPEGQTGPAGQTEPSALSGLAAPPDPPGAKTEDYRFTPGQLAVYGVFELQVLEEFLRRPPGAETEHALIAVCEKICRKIGWKEPVPAHETRRFLTSFYTAERANLERGQLFGRRKEDKGDTA